MKKVVKKWRLTVMEPPCNRGGYRANSALTTTYSIFFMPLLIVLRHFLIRMSHERLDIFLREFLLLVQPCTQYADLVKSGALSGRHVVIGVRCVPGLAELLGQVVRRYRCPVILGVYLLPPAGFGLVVDQVGRGERRHSPTTSRSAAPMVIFRCTGLS